MSKRVDTGYEDKPGKFKKAGVYKMSEETISGFAVIPSGILFCEDLNDFEKILYGAISSLAHKNGYCYAKNAFFEKTFKKSESTIIRAINHLCELGFIERKVIYKDDTKEVLGRYLFVTALRNQSTPTSKNDTTPPVTGDTTPTSKNDRAYNINLYKNSLAHTREENSNQQGYEIIKNKPDNVDENLTDEQRRNLTNQLLDTKNSNDEIYVSFTSPRHYASEKDWFKALKLGKDIYDFTIPNLLYLHLVPYLEHKRGRPLKDLEIKRLGTQLKDYVGASQLEIVRRCIKGNFGDIKPFGTDMLRKDNPYMAWELGDNYEI